VALPWEIAQAAVWQTWGRDVTGLTVILVALAYLVAGAQFVLVFAGGRPIYDRLAATVVRPVPFAKAPQAEATSNRHRLVQSRMATWLLGSAVGVVVVALPDNDTRVLTLSRAHGPSLVDGLGMVILIAAWVPLVALLWSSLSALRCGFGFGAATLAVGGAVLLVVTIGGDTGAEWLIAVGMLIAAQLMAVGLAWRGVRT